MAPALDMALSLMLSTIGIEWGEADERSDLSPGEGAEFRQKGDQRGGGAFADARGGAQQGLGLAPEFVGVQEGVDVAIGVLDALFEEADEFIDAGEGGFVGAFASVLLGGEHIDELSAAQDKSLQLLGLLVVQGPHGRLDGCAEVRDDTRIDAIGFSLLAVGSGEVAHPLGIDRDRRQAGLAQGFQDGAFELSGGFEHDQLRLERCEACDELGETFGRIGDAKGLAGLVIGDVEELAADIDADEQRRGESGLDLVHHSTHTCKDTSSRLIQLSGFGAVRRSGATGFLSGCKPM
ncbi:hypothetical protein AWB74_08857 [Caballeronia arvi]|uniref:Uncharacterized protein n=1 Tax=Caballeronia arvi TaxID=1777135 RepID=A0A158L6M1_9BURK|nr:hypothetical protein AWB74_08857 [Caballeronia arvi]